MPRRTSSTSWLAVALGCVATNVAAEAPGMSAALSCRPEAAPGRVLCELSCSARAGVRLVWADALVTEAPAFARPLRARVSPERFGELGQNQRKLGLAFVASQPGTGQVSVRARAVVCRGQADQERCRPETHDVRAELRVGS
jgi:hypothetical protein